MNIPEIKEKIKQKSRLAKHISRQLALPLDKGIIRLKLQQSDKLNKEIYNLKKMLGD